MFSGAYTALVTPFGNDGEIDYPGVARLLAWHESEGMDGVVIAGTNGEGPSLSAIEKRDLTKFAVSHAGSLKIIFGAGTCSLPEAIWLCNQAEKSGAVAALVLPPFYFSPTESGIEQWFTSLVDNTKIPVILYNFPKPTKITLSPHMVGRLLTQDRIIGIKDSSGDEGYLNDCLAETVPKSKSMLVGDERLLLTCLKQGGSGTISGLANSFPRLVSRQVAEQTDTMQTLINEAVANVKCHPQPAVHKAILNHKGLPGGRVRLPLVDLDEAAKQAALDFVNRFGF